MWDNFVFSINFASYKREPKVPHNSEVLKLLREREQEDKNTKSGVGGMSQENRNYNSNDLTRLLHFYYPTKYLVLMRPLK